MAAAATKQTKIRNRMKKDADLCATFSIARLGSTSIYIHIFCVFAKSVMDDAQTY